MDDVAFTFDTLPFSNGVEKITKLMQGFGNVVGAVANKASGLLSALMQGAGESVAKGINKIINSREVKQAREALKGGGGGMTTMMMAKGMILANVVMGLVKKVFNTIKQNLPELSRTMSIAGDIFTRNFLWPLRKELMPYLQKILDWTRDHRATFVKWGGMLVNVFRIIKETVIGLINMGKALSGEFLKVWQGVFGKTSKSLSDFLYILMFKIQGTIIFIQALVMPLIESIGRAIGFIAVGVKGLIDGIIQGAGEIVQPLSEIIQMLSQFINELVGGEAEAQGFYQTMKIVGDFIGTTLVAAFDLLAASIRTVIDLVRIAISAFKIMFSSDIGTKIKEMEKMKSTASGWMGYMGKKGGDIVNRYKGFADRTFGDREDMRSPKKAVPMTSVVDNSRSMKQETKVNIQSVVVQTTSDDPRGHGKLAADAIGNNLSDIIKRDMQLMQNWR